MPAIKKSLKKETVQHFRGSPSKGIKEGAGAVDRENNIIHGFSVITKGEAKGHDMLIDDKTLDQVVEHGNSHKMGMKSRFGHPNMSSDALGTFIGRTKNFYRDGDQVRADLHIDDTAFKTPNGDLGSYVLDLAEKDPSAFASSIVFACSLECQKNEDGEEDRDKMPFARVKELDAVDLVDDAAANDGLFSRYSPSVRLSAEVTEQLEKFLEDEGSFDKAMSFLKRTGLLDNPENVKKLDKILERFRDKQQSTSEGVIAMKKCLHCGKDMDEKLSTCPHCNKDQALAVAPAVPVAQASGKSEAELAREAERLRASEILSSCRAQNVPVAFGEELIAAGTPRNEALKKIIDKAAELHAKNVPAGNVILQGATDSEKFRSIAVDAISLQHRLPITEKQEDIRKSGFAGIGLQQLGRLCLERAGVSGVMLMNADDLFVTLMRQVKLGGAMGQGTGDFTYVLSNVLNKAMGRGWEQAGTTYQLWCGTGSLRDFKEADIVKISMFSDVEEIKEGDAPNMGAFSDTKETAKLITIGRAYTLTRQAFVNDDMNVFTRIPMALTGSTRRYVNRYAYNHIFNGNGTPGTAFAGPTMKENSAVMFSTARGNRAAAGAAPGETTFNTGFDAMANFTPPSPDGGKSNAIYMNLKPKFVIYGPHWRIQIQKLLGSLYYPVTGQESTGSLITNVFGPGQPDNVIPVQEALVDHLASNKYPWWLACDPMLCGTVTIYTLNGQDAPITRSEPSAVGEAQGMKYDVTYDFIAQAEDWRGMYVNEGA